MTGLPTEKFRRALSLVLVFCFLAPSLSFGKDKAEPKRSWKEYFRREEPSKSEKDSEEFSPEGMIDLIDSPTTNVIDYGAVRMNFRLYSNGGLLSHLSFGVFRRLNIGGSWDNEEVIGSNTPKTNAPTLNVKLRVYDGDPVLPSVAIGYDGQGRFFDRVLDQYNERERGLFLALGRELFFSGLETYGGVNIAQFKEGIVLGWVGLSYRIQEKLALLTEYDNIRSGPDNRWNAGVRFFPLPSLALDFAFRRIASNKDKERIIRINYVASF